MYAPGMGLGRPCWLLVHALIPARPPRCASRCRPKAMHLYQPDRRGALRATGPRTHTINVTPGTGGGRPVVPGAGIYKRPTLARITHCTWNRTWATLQVALRPTSHKVRAFAWFCFPIRFLSLLLYFLHPQGTSSPAALPTLIPKRHESPISTHTTSPRPKSFRGSVRPPSHPSPRTPEV
jgi:hypothetical protein